MYIYRCLAFGDGVDGEEVGFSIFCRTCTIQGGVAEVIALLGHKRVFELLQCEQGSLRDDFLGLLLAEE